MVVLEFLRGLLLLHNPDAAAEALCLWGLGLFVGCGSSAKASAPASPNQQSHRCLCFEPVCQPPISLAKIENSASWRTSEKYHGRAEFPGFAQELNLSKSNFNT